MKSERAELTLPGIHKRQWTSAVRRIFNHNGRKLQCPCGNGVPGEHSVKIITEHSFSDPFQANNIRGQWKRAICSAIFVGLGASGGMTGSLVYRSQDAPTYHPGILTCVGLSCLIIVLVVLLSIRFYFLNRKVARGEIVIANLPGFRYTY